MTLKQQITKITALLIMAISFNIGFAADDWARFSRFETKNDSLKAIEGWQPKAVFMGNSITEGWINNHPEFFSKNNFVGRGISGQTSYQMLLRFRDDVINLHPEIAVINAGTNDVAENNHVYNEDRTLGNIISMAELANANGIKVVLTSVLPAEKFGWRKEIEGANAKIKSLNNRIKQYAETNNYPYVDYYSLMNIDDKALNPAYSNDGVHPTSSGYDVMESLILPVIQNIR